MVNHCQGSSCYQQAPSLAQSRVRGRSCRYPWTISFVPPTNDIFPPRITKNKKRKTSPLDYKLEVCSRKVRKHLSVAYWQEAQTGEQENRSPVKIQVEGSIGSSTQVLTGIDRILPVHDRCYREQQRRRHGTRRSKSSTLRNVSGQRTDTAVRSVHRHTTSKETTKFPRQKIRDKKSNQEPVELENRIQDSKGILIMYIQCTRQDRNREIKMPCR